MRVAEVQRDERTEQVESAGIRRAYTFLSFGVLAAGAYRSYFLHQNTFDLLGLVMGAGAIILFSQASQRAMPRGLIWLGVGTAVIAALMAAVFASLTR